MNYFLMTCLCDDCKRRFSCTWKSDIMANCSEFISDVYKKEEKKMVNAEYTVASCEKCSHNKVCQHKYAYANLLERMEKEFNRIVNCSEDLPDWLVGYYRPKCMQYQEEAVKR